MTVAVASRPSLAARLVIAGVRGYQLLRSGRVSPCRFTPTCSNYAVEAVSAHGAGRGLRLTAKRLGRCRPGGPSGYDPVPDVTWRDGEQRSAPPPNENRPMRTAQ